MQERDVLTQRIGRKARAQLAEARVGIAGLGGLGSNIAVYLTRSGVGALHLVDFDRVDLSNLNRQHYFRSDVGKPKVEALARQLWDINPEMVLALDAVRVQEDNALALFEGESLVCEAFDQPGAKALLVNTLLGATRDTVVVAASGVAGTGPASSMVTRHVAPRFYLCGDGVSDVAAGEPLYAPRVALCAAQQALIVIRIILGIENPFKHTELA